MHREEVEIYVVDMNGTIVGYDWDYIDYIFRSPPMIFCHYIHSSHQIYDFKFHEELTLFRAPMRISEKNTKNSKSVIIFILNYKKDIIIEEFIN